MRQYIGARYVPIFADPLTWDNTHSYEALVMVDYMGDTYTSKKPVPPGVAITDTEYWVMTGSFNSQLSQIRTDVEDLQKHVYRKYLFVADSYGTSIVPDIVSMLGLTSDDYTAVIEGGSGFGAAYGASTNWQTMIENTVTTDDDTYTDVVYIGGCNEAACAEATITTNAANCYEYVKTRFVNAKQWYMFAGYFGGVDGDTYDIAWRYRINRRLPLCLTATKKAFIMNEVWYPLADTNNLNSVDLEHPTAGGSAYVAAEICSCLMGGKADYKTDASDTFTLTSSHTVNYFNGFMYRHNDEVHGFIRSAQIAFDSPIQIVSSGTTFTLGTIPSRLIRGGQIDSGQTNDLFLGSLILVTSESGTIRTLPAEMYLSKANELKLRVSPAWNDNPGYYITSCQIAYFKFDLNGYMN